MSKQGPRHVGSSSPAGASLVRTALGGAALAVVGAFAIVMAWLGRAPLQKGMPGFDLPHVLVMLLSAGASALFVAAVRSVRPCGDGHASDARTRWRSWGELRWLDGAGSLRLTATAKQLLVWSIALGTLGFVLGAREGPVFANRLAREDGPVETLSALLLLAAGGVFAGVALRARRRAAWRTATIAAAAAVAGLLFLTAMEEVSWFQRYLEIETPALLSANDQGEMNLHNLATWEAEQAYYFGAFLLLVVLPFVVDHGRLSRLGIVAALAPGRLPLYAGSVTVAFSFTMWNVPLTQLAFFTTLFVLLHYAWRDRRSRRGRRRAPVPAAAAPGSFSTAGTALVLAVTLVATQAGFLAIGHTFPRSYMLTEYRELLIPMALLVWALEVWERLAAAPAGA